MTPPEGVAQTDETAPADAPYCYLTTTGRVTRRPHTVELWFVLIDTTVYLMHQAATPADWVRNLARDPAVTIRLASREAAPIEARARIVEPSISEATAPRRLMAAKYQSSWESDLTEWARTATIVAVDLP